MNAVEVVKGQGRALTATEFIKLADVPPEIEWFANLCNPNTRKAYETDLREFQRFVGIERPEEFRTVTRAHVIAWRKDLERRLCAPTTIQRKLAALSSLFAYLAEQNAVLHNPVDGVKRPKSNRQEGTTPALSDEQARALLNAPAGDSLKAKRDRAIWRRWRITGCDGRSYVNSRSGICNGAMAWCNFALKGRGRRSATCR